MQFEEFQIITKAAGAMLTFATSLNKPFLDELLS
jgi:hypothetical protein